MTVRAALLVASSVLALSTPALARERYALIVSGASGGPPYREQYSRWAADLSRVLIDRMLFARSNVVLLQDTESGPAAATAASTRRAVASIRGRLASGDLLLVVLIGLALAAFLWSLVT